MSGQNLPHLNYLDRSCDRLRVRRRLGPVVLQAQIVTSSVTPSEIIITLGSSWSRQSIIVRPVTSWSGGRNYENEYYEHRIMFTLIGGGVRPESC